MSRAKELLASLELREAIPKNHKVHPAKHMKMASYAGPKKAKWEALLQEVRDFNGTMEAFKKAFDAQYLPKFWEVYEELQRPDTSLPATPSTATETMKKIEFVLPKECMEAAVKMIKEKLGADAEVAQDGEDKMVISSKEDVEEIVMMVLKDLGLIEDGDEEDPEGETPAADGAQEEANKNLQKNGKAKTFGKGKKAGKKMENNNRDLPEAFGRQPTNPDDAEAIEEIRKDGRGAVGLMNSFFNKG